MRKDAEISYHRRSYRLSDIEDFPSLRIKWNQSGSDEVSSPRLHSAVQHLIQIHLNTT